MSLRAWITLAFAPSVLPGIRFGDWCRLLCENRFRVDPRYSIRAASITLFSLVNSAVGWYERRRYGAQIEATAVQEPLFILGHWRSGTTLLHNLLSVDPRFATPTLYEVLFPHTFLTTERLLSGLLSTLLPRTRYTDSVGFRLDVPYEDEFAICATGLCSPHLSVVFPHRSQHYDRYLTLRALSEPETARWQSAYTYFLKKLTLKHQRRLVLKSPPHTARVRFLLELFPDAKFLHIHRDPYAVYQSTLRIAMDSSSRQRLQRPTLERFEDRVVRVYKLMHDAFFEDRERIPAGKFHEMSFEDLERDPLGELGRAYHALELPSFEHIERDVRTYVNAIAGYRKNTYRPLPEPVRQRIAHEWQRCFDEWGYPV